MTHDPQTDLSPAKLAAKRALVVHALACEIQAVPQQKGRLQKLGRIIEETDAITGVGPGPETPELGEVGSAAFHHALAAFYRRHRRMQLAIEACAAGAAADPHDVVLRRLWLETLNSAGRLGEAGPVLDVPLDMAGGPDETAATELLQQAERLLGLAGEHALALDARERAARLGPLNSAILLQLAVRAEAIGDQARAAGFRAQLRKLWAKELPPRLADGLAELERSTQRIRFPEDALTWAWALADKQVYSREAWLRSLEWGAQATRLLLRWWSSYPERGDEILDLVDAPDLEPIRAGHAAGRGQILAGAHGGPLPAAIHLFEASGLPFRTLGGTGLDRVAGQGGTLIGLERRSTASRALIEEIRRAAVIAMAADTPTVHDRVELEFLGRKIAVKSLPARLAQRYGCDTWWYQPVWRGDRIAMELEPMPRPEPDEPPAQWAERWARAYLKRLERLMRGDPRNLNLSGGIWRFAGDR
jgi:hypothetical protein